MSLLIGAVWKLVPAFSFAKAVLFRWHELVTQVLAMGLLDLTFVILS